jgi:hypothetical protein
VAQLRYLMAMFFVNGYQRCLYLNQRQFEPFFWWINLRMRNVRCKGGTGESTVWSVDCLPLFIFNPCLLSRQRMFLMICDALRNVSIFEPLLLLPFLAFMIVNAVPYTWHLTQGNNHRTKVFRKNRHAKARIAIGRTISPISEHVDVE